MQPESIFSFTKLVVNDIEAQADFYCQVYGLHAVHWVRGQEIDGEEIDEVMMSADPNATWSTLALLRYVDRTAPVNDEVILGFTTDDLPALIARVEAAGGRVHDPIRAMPELQIRVAFVKDPEGHTNELVQIVP